MKTILDYVEVNGNKSFDVFPYNEVDSVILTMLSYLDLEAIVSYDDIRKETFKDVKNNFFKIITDKKEIKYHGIGLRSAYNLMCKLKESIRYDNLLLYNYDYQSHEDLQFSAMCIDIDSKTTYISFEGTDDLVSGWKEDCESTYMFPTNSQKLAIEYINKNIKKFSRRKYIIGGHSKGGNLSLVGSMYCNILAKRKIEKIYSYDGPGLRKQELNSIQYRSIRKRFEHIIPDHSIAGLFMRNDGKYRVVKAKEKGIMAHDPITWSYENNHFINSKLASSSIKLDNELKAWIDEYSLEERKVFVDEVFNVFDKLGITDFSEVKAKMIPKMIKIIGEIPNLDKKTRTILSKLVKSIFRALFE